MLSFSEVTYRPKWRGKTYGSSLSNPWETVAHDLMARIASDENDKIIKMGSYESLQDTFEHSKIWSTIFQKLNVKTTIRYTKLIKLLPDMVKHGTLKK